jgi:hypothetical protein
LVTWHMEAQARLAKETPFFNTIDPKRTSNIGCQPSAMHS